MGSETSAATTDWLSHGWAQVQAGDGDWVAVLVAVVVALVTATVFLARQFFRKNPQPPDPAGQRTTSVHGGQNHAQTVIHGFTPQHFEEQLERRTRFLTDRIRELYSQKAELIEQGSSDANQKALADNAEALHLAEAGRAEAEEKLRNLDQAYNDTLEELERRQAELKALQEDAPGIDTERLAEALAALAENRTEQADALLADLQQSNADAAAIARQARVSYERGRLAEDRIDYAAAKSHFIRAAQLAPENADFLQKASDLSDKGGDYAQGLRFAQDLMELAKPDGEETVAFARAANWVAYNLNALGRYEEAEPLFRRGLEIRELVLGPDHPDTATSNNNVAANLNAQGRFAEAEPLYRKGLAIRERVLGPDHPDTAAGYNNVAANLYAQDRYAEAEPVYRKGLAIRERVLGPDHPDTAASYNNVAASLNAQGRYAEAEPLYRKGLEIRERVLGPDHPNTALSYNNLAANLNALRRHAEAEPLFRKGLEIQERVLGPDHPDTASSYNNVATNLFYQGRVAEAEPYLRKAVEIVERLLGPDHPNARTMRANLEVLEQRLGKGR